jgi:lysophospholipid acyltransferase (LPLAT)-like uncharacterized protein
MAIERPDITEEQEALCNEGVLHRARVWFISELGYWIISLIGRTLRWEVDGGEHHTMVRTAGKRIIYASWHGRILLGTYHWQHQGIVVMTSLHTDGDYIARTIRRFGFGTARGSSTRNAKRALVGMIRALRAGNDVGFTIDGPRGPRYVAKAGAVWLAAKTGNPVLPFCASAQKKWVLSSWDAFEIPIPFSRALILIGRPISVNSAADDEELEEARRTLQASLEDLRARADHRWDPPMRETGTVTQEEG